MLCCLIMFFNNCLNKFYQTSSWCGVGIIRFSKRMEWSATPKSSNRVGSLNKALKTVSKVQSSFIVTTLQFRTKILQYKYC